MKKNHQEEIYQQLGKQKWARNSRKNRDLKNYLAALDNRMPKITHNVSGH